MQKVKTSTARGKDWDKIGPDNGLGRKESAGNL